MKHHDPVFLVGSCFSENIGNRMAALKFNILQNPNGILYDPVSVTESIISYIDRKEYGQSDLFEHDGLWHSWQHHSSFSGTDKESVLAGINQSQERAHQFLKTARWVFITLGSSFSYKLTTTGDPVANCHKVPTKTFHKQLLTIEEIKSAMDTCIHRLFHFNNQLNIVFTVSPVRYIRDGLVENNLSKARLIEVVQHLVTKFSRLHYFPAYELVIDVLRDYRFFKEDMVHPGDQAIDYVFDAFKSAVLDKETLDLVHEISAIRLAMNHRPLHPQGAAHARFKEALLARMVALENRFNYLDFSTEKSRFEE
jgi:hypothetical protein